MALSDSTRMAEMIQAFSAMPQFREAMQNPQLMAELMGQLPKPMNNIPESLDTVAEIETARKRWEAESMITPYKPPPVSHAELCASGNKIEQELNNARDGYLFLKTFVGQDKTFSSTPISQLKKISLSDMLVHKKHKGRYLVCRTFLKTVRRVAVELRVEDPKGDVILIVVYNFPGLFQATLNDLDAHFPVGQELAIREPWMKGTSGGSNSGLIIRVDSPSDLILLDKDDSIVQGITWKTSIAKNPLQTAEQYKAAGNKYFERGLFTPAAFAWSRGLKIDPSMYLLRLNRAQAYLRLRWYSAALSDALHVLAHPNLESNITRKAAFRAACAEYGLGRYTQARTRFRELDQDPELRDWILRCEKRIEEATMGKYDWMQMYHDSKSPVPCLDVAEFVSPAITVATIPNRGGRRGIRATRDIDCGELLVLAKPFACVFPAELNKNEVVYGLNFTTKRADKTASIALITRIVTRLYGCPQDSNLINGLYAGSKFPTPPASYPPPAVDVQMNMPLQCAIDIDIGRIDGIVTFNAFSPNQLREITPETLQIERDPNDGADGTETPSALYTVPSLFNHSCQPNATWQCFGDVMVIRAREFIQLGCEITLAYLGMGAAFNDRDAKLKSIIERSCDCRLCTLDRQLGHELRQKRERLVSNKRGANRNAGSSMTNRNEAETFLKELVSTYSAQESVPRQELFEAYSQVMQIMERDGNLEGRPDLLKLSIKLGYNALKAAGFRDIDTRMTRKGRNCSRFALPLSKKYLSTPSAEASSFCAILMAHISASFLTLGEDILAERWFRAAWWAHEASVGGCQALFDARLHTLIDPIPKVDSMKYRWD